MSGPEIRSIKHTDYDLKWLLAHKKPVPLVRSLRWLEGNLRSLQLRLGLEPVLLVTARLLAL
jgi:hypothetical protein